MNKLSQAAAILGKKGGESGTGKSKARFSETCSRAAYKRWGDPIARFWAKVKKGKPNECWPWMGGTGGGGYGSVTYMSRKQNAHRVAYLFTYGECDPSKDVCHSCDNPICCNPAHLWMGTTSENVLDSVRKGRFNKVKGEDHPRAILTPEKVKQIRNLVPQVGIAETARRFHTSEGCIAGVVKRRTWSHIS